MAQRFLNRGCPPFREWVVRRYPCANCGKRASDPAHVVSKAKGGYDVGDIVPMCTKCHRYIQHGVDGGWSKLDITQADAALLAIKYAIKWYEVTTP